MRLSIFIKYIFGLYKIRRYLQKGVYFFDFKEKLVYKNKFGVPIMFKIREPIDIRLKLPFKLYQGNWSKKFVCISNNFVVSLYDKKGNAWLSNIKKYYDQLNYYKNSLVSLDIKKGIAVFEYIDGETINDLDRIYMVAEHILDCNLKSIFYSTTVLDIYKDFFGDSLKIFGCVQHGDLGNNNVFWQGEKTFSVFDLDTIDIYPLLYDFFRLILLNHMNEELENNGFLSFIGDRFDGFLSPIASKIDMNLLSFKDLYLSIFILRVYKFWNVKCIFNYSVPKEYVYLEKVKDFIKKES